MQKPRNSISVDDAIAEFEQEFTDILPGATRHTQSDEANDGRPSQQIPPLFFKDDLLAEFLTLSEMDAKYFLEMALKQRRELFEQVMHQYEQASSSPSSPKTAAVSDPVAARQDRSVNFGSSEESIQSLKEQHARELDEMLARLRERDQRIAVLEAKEPLLEAVLRPQDDALDSTEATNHTIPDDDTVVCKQISERPQFGKILTNGDAAGGGKAKLLRSSTLNRGSLTLHSDLKAEDAARAKQELPMVQFSAFMYFCNETEDYMSLDVMRIGDLSSRSVVHFTTRDATATAGERYKFTTGEIVFEPGESEKDISIQIYCTALWDTTTEFAVDLVKEGPHAPVGCTLGRYLWTTRVKVIDNGTFPSEKFRTEILNGQIDQINPWSLIFEYFKLDFRINKVVKRGTIKTVLVGQCHNFYLLMKLFMSVYLVDDVLQGKRLIGGSQEACLIIFGVLLVLPFVALHRMDYLEPSWKVGGGSRALLQKALLRKFLNYCESARAELKKGDLVMAMTRDSVNLVQEGYMNSLDMIKSTGELFMILSFLALAPALLGTEPRISGFVIIGCFPLVLISFLLYRQKRTTKFVHAKERCQDALVGQVDRTVTNYRMIADYNRRPFFVARYEARIKDFNKAAIFEAQVLKNNNYCPMWLTVLFVAFYTVIGGLQVGKGITLGMYLANLNVIAVTGTAWGDIYRVLLDMQRVFPALECIVKLLNMPIDIPERMALNRYRRQKTSDLRAELRKKGCAGLPLDYLPITLVNVEFSYSTGNRQTMEPTSSVSSTITITDTSDGINSQGKMTVQQGTMVSLVGPRGEGKSTILKIIGGVILPQPGSFFIPSHLRILHMSTEPLFFLGSLYENLTFGITPGDKDGDIERVSEICRRLDLPQRLQILVAQGQEGETLIWGEVLSYTQRCLLCLARALVTNPEVLCIHKPTMSYDENTSVRVLNLLKEFVTDKGVMQDIATRHRRRPRTCIFTSSKIQGVDISDEVYLVSKSEGIRRVEKHLVSADMLG